ncbi:MAG TPA: DUF3857 and transglutaminase domain-containing protein [Myxococcota bacterium]|jgi:transglutaminase-like putative cysteine protease|nr:DUF3857 and transglutaminase domain-containing protein [Myxococcota bacterium]
MRLLEEEGHGYTDLLREHTIHLGADGTVVDRVTQMRLFLTDEGARNGGILGLPVRTALERLRLERVEVRQEDGSRIGVDPARIQVSTNVAPGVFSDVAVVTVPFPALRRGATAIVVGRYESQRSAFPLTWSDLFYPERDAPTERFSVVVTWDEGVPDPRFSVSAGGVVCSTDGPRRLRCEQDRVPAARTDPDITNWTELTPELAVALPSSWEELSRQELALVESAIREDPRLDDVAARLVEPGSTPRELLGRVHRFVADEVRYVAFEHGVGAVAPRPAVATLSSGYGDCKDKVTLFLALARKVGLDAWPVLVASDRFLVSRLSVASWRYFDHMIACVSLPDADTVCVDPTAHDVATGRLPEWLHGRVALDLGRGATAPRRLDAPTIARHVEIESEREIACDGRMQESLAVSFAEGVAEGVRARLRPLAADERRRWALDVFRSTVGETPVPTVELGGVDDAEVPVVLRAKATYAGTGDVERESGWADPDSWLVRFANALATQNRFHPYWISGLEVQSHLRYRICPRVSLTLPGAELNFEAPWGKLVRTYQIDPQEVRVETTFSAPTAVVGVDELGAFSRFLRTSLGQTRIWFGWMPLRRSGT